MRKILWYAFLLIPAVFTSCNLEDDSGLIPQENRKLTISFSVQDPASGLAICRQHGRPRTVCRSARERKYKNARFDFLRIKR